MSRPKKKHKPGVIRDTPLLDGCRLAAVLDEKLNAFERMALEKEVDRLQRQAVQVNIVPAVADTHRLDYGIAMRILKDRFAFEAPQLREFFDLVQDYMRDYDEGRLNLREILDTLEHEDQIRLTWSIKVNEIR